MISSSNSPVFVLIEILRALHKADDPVKSKAISEL
jgi:repressor of nif and glnA expression